MKRLETVVFPNGTRLVAFVSKNADSESGESYEAIIGGEKYACRKTGDSYILIYKIGDKSNLGEKRRFVL
mgnify:CR=1 FL=1